MVFASRRTAADAPTVLFYMHFDGQPVVDAQWHQLSPWVATIKRSPEGSEIKAPFQEVLCARNADPDLRIVARSAADDKGPIMMFLAVAKAMDSARIQPSVNVKVLLDSEEELGSPSISRVLKRYRSLLRATGLIIYDGPMRRGNAPLIELGNRGLLLARLTVWGPLHAAHSGYYSNFIPNPVFGLARLLASMKDENGRVSIPGFYVDAQGTTGIKCDNSLDRTDAAALKSFAIEIPERGVVCSLGEAAYYPTINVAGINAGVGGSRLATIIPDSATAALDLRTTPARTPEETSELVRTWITSQGYLVLARAPTLKERLSNERIASWTSRVAGLAASTPATAAVVRWTSTGLAETFRAPPTVIGMIGATVPTGELARALRVPFAIVPLVNGDDNQHSFDENLRLGNYLDGIVSIFGLLRTPFPK